MGARPCWHRPLAPILILLGLAALPAGGLAQDVDKTPPEDVLEAAESVVAVHTTLTNGAGFVVEGADEEVVTHDGVVRGEDTARITTLDGRALEGTVIGRDPVAGLAVLSVPGVRVPSLPVAGESADDEDEVFAIGRPLGYRDRLRRLEVDDLSNEGAERRIQLDDSGSPDGLGGPLVTADGSVVGVVVGEADAGALAVPVGRVARVVRTGTDGVPWSTVGLGAIGVIAVVVGLATWSAARGQRRWRERYEGTAEG